MACDIICEAAVCGSCSQAQSFSHLHCNMPYLWQINMSGEWRNLDPENEVIERAYCSPDSANLSLELQAYSAQDGSRIRVSGSLDFSAMRALLSRSGMPVSQAQIRRLSTPSYSQRGHRAMTGCHTYLTQWRWYWLDCNTWRLFGETAHSPLQSVLEAKYLHGQVVYRFQVTKDETNQDGPLQDHTILLRFPDFLMLSLNHGMQFKIIRRPLFISTEDVLLKKCLSDPQEQSNVKVLHSTPEDWVPVDVHCPYELVPLAPGSAAEQRVSRSVLCSLPSASVLDVFRLQNPFLWLKYSAKKQQMAAQGSCVEKQLFHGTSEPSAVKAICQQNLDWRLCGKNGTKYGKGAYFACKASMSDRYTGNGDEKRWLFYVRVLVGVSAVGHAHYTRPPPTDPARPYEDQYDSCVDNLHKPTLYVLFDSDQYYPEYAICYKNSNQ